MNTHKSPSFRLSRSPVQKSTEIRSQQDIDRNQDSISSYSRKDKLKQSFKQNFYKSDVPSCSKVLSETNSNESRKKSLHVTNSQVGLSSLNVFQPSIKYRNVGKSGLRMSTLGLCIWQNMSSKLNESIVENIIQTAFENGIFYFDTGDAFNNGKSEKLFGSIVKKLQWNRSHFVLSTKLFWNHPLDQPNTRNIALSRKYLIEAVQASLKRLQMDYLDILILNRLDGICPTEEIVRTMDILINRGLILYWGTSRWSHVHIAEAFSVARQFNCIPPIVEQMEYSAVTNREKCELNMNELYHRLGIGVTSWSVNTLNADPGINLISRKSLIEYQDSLFAEESQARSVVTLSDRIEDSNSIKQKNNENNENKRLSSLGKLSIKLSASERKKIDKTLIVNNDRSVDRLSIDQSIEKRNSLSMTEKMNKLFEFEAILTKLNCTKAQFDIAWNLKFEHINCVLVQPESIKQLQQFIEALKLDIPINIVNDIDRISQKPGFKKFSANIEGSSFEIGDLESKIEDEPYSNV